jgi:hexosaminidase
MALHKMNVFHWHLTDDQGWRIEIKKYPNLTEVGSKRADTQIGGWDSDQFSGQSHEGFYTQDQIREIVQYATERHIIIVPEIEMPGHASAAIASYPWLGASGKKIEVSVRFGKHYDIFNVADPQVEQFLTDILLEIMDLFPSKVIHIGGDEVKYNQWKESKQIQIYMKEEGLKTPADLQIHFTNKISNFIESQGRRMMGWNEILGGHVLHAYQSDEDTKVSEKLAQNAIIHFWKGDLQLAEEAVLSGYDIVNSYHKFTYLDYTYKDIPLQKAYNFDPIPEGLDSTLHIKVLGLGCQMWGEWIPTVERMEYQVYPRLSAYAEVGWTDKDMKDFDDFMFRLETMKNRWENLGIQFAKLELANQKD